jgi:hypothetical protein
MGPRRLLPLLAAAFLLVPALPVHAQPDTVAPHSSFRTKDRAVVVYSPFYSGKVEGDSTDDVGLRGVLIRYCNTAFCQYRFEENLCLPNCAAPTRQPWTFDIPPDGTWQVNVRAVDTAGNMEEPGPEITISVLPVQPPQVEAPRHPLVERLLEPLLPLLPELPV